MASLSRLEALDILELGESCDRASIKRAYRRLARLHHPDTGGDVETFRRVQLAYECLRVGVEPAASGGRRPRQATRPSRPPGGHASPSWGHRAYDEARLAAVDWELARPDPTTPATRDRVAAALARAHADALHPVTLRSRAPGSRLNRVSRHLDADLLADLTIAVTRDRRAPAGRDIEVRMRASARKARRHLDRATLDAGCVRERGSSWSQLRIFVAPSADPRVTALRTADCAAALCDGLSWPLTSWLLVS